jgi:hypothetical protein
MITRANANAEPIKAFIKRIAFSYYIPYNVEQFVTRDCPRDISPPTVEVTASQICAITGPNEQKVSKQNTRIIRNSVDELIMRVNGASGPFIAHGRNFSEKM